MSRPRIAVIGAGFGAHYACALAAPESPARLTAVVGTGGARGRRLASDLGVEYRTGIDGLAVDAAVVAVRSRVVGGAGDMLAHRLLDDRIAVLQELPVHSTDVAAGVRLAARRQVAYQLNPFYPGLQPVLRFIARARALSEQVPVHHVLVRTCVQTLQAAIFVLGELLPGPPPRRVKVLTGQQRAICTLDWNGVEVDLVVTNRLDPADPDSMSHPLMAWSLSCADGELVLDHPHAPTRWLPRPHLHGGELLFPDAAAATVLSPAEDPTGEQVLSAIWPPAIRAAVGRLVSGFAVPDQRTLALVRLWETASVQMPTPHVVPAHPPRERAAMLERIR